jgi:hypothetical protein
MEPVIERQIETPEAEEEKVLDVEPPVVIEEAKPVEVVTTNESSVLACGGDEKTWWASVSSWWNKLRCMLAPAPATSAVLSSEVSK